LSILFFAFHTLEEEKKKKNVLVEILMKLVERKQQNFLAYMGRGDYAQPEVLWNRKNNNGISYLFD
jgi:hypothetical protein